ncbi:MAG: OFA family MFS transporter [Cellulomonadaceae bacterium]|jgi:OFA family oxalate/formate antiporter-like MFS transporter|nr:OFA family MFS transporter [Cellulomonadaceae bacterium]
MNKNKYVNGILPMILINFSIGSVYCWTLFKEHIWEYTGFSHSVTEWAFSLAIFCLGMSAAFGGRIVEKDPNKSAFMTFVMFTSGWLITGYGIYSKNAAIMVAGFGVVQGVGLGLGYITPVKTLMIWMGNKKGFAAGLTIAGFALAGVLANPLIAFLLERMAVYQVFWLLGGVYGVCLFTASKLLHRPEYHEQASEEEHQEFSVRAIIATPKFAFLWFVFFVNITAGLALISQEKQIYLHIGETNVATIVALVSIAALFNLAGRLSMASLQDHLRAKHGPYYLMAGLSISVALLAVLMPGSVVMAFVLIGVVQFFFGCGFSCMPNILHQNWGMKYLSTVHGLMLSAWAVAGLVGNQVASHMLDTYGVRPLYLMLAVLFAVEAVALVTWVRVSSRDRVLEPRVRSSQRERESVSGAVPA